MRRFSQVNGQDLVWTQADCRQHKYELWADGELVARLRWPGESLAIAGTADSRCSFERPVLRRSPVIVRALESGAEIAIFGSGWTGGGTLETSRGRRFVWSAANYFWRSRWRWQDRDGATLALFEGRQRLVKAEGRVRVEEAALALPELDLLVMLGWYLTVMRTKDSIEDAVAATAGTAGS